MVPKFLIATCLMIASVSWAQMDGEPRAFNYARHADKNVDLAGFGVGYGPFRDGQKPGGPWPTKEQIREDLHVIAQHWRMLRTYGSDEFSRHVCEVIKEDDLPLTIMVGVWVATEKDDADQQKANQTQVDGAINIANDFPGIVSAVCVGNESQVFWSFHKVETETLIKYIRQVRSSVSAPVTVADDFLFWIDEASQPVAEELDFLVTHIYAMWHAQPLEKAIAFTDEKFKEVQKKHPAKLIVLGEAGWCTEKQDEGDQANRLQGAAGEAEQAEFFHKYKDWVLTNSVVCFYFTAFDENWKGSDDPQDAEKHWGVFRADRTPKAAMAVELQESH
jgi:exo-beta-1,3-glucanase (GH17 family)